MIKIILILALLQYIYNFIFGYKSNIVGCGIFGQASNKASDLDVNAVHILGIYNVERGKMSCGLTWDGDIQYGLGFDKLYTDFIVDREIKPKTVPIMFGHTRQPSYGAHVTIDNAHPFGFGVNKTKDSFGMIFCHNGTLKNHKELAKKYDIDLSETIIKNTVSNHSYEKKRDKIDSEILGEILYKTKTFHVLSEYIGAAALAWTWIDEPNKIYLWSGASKEYKNSIHGIEKEERPLNVYCKDNNNMFFSSLHDSLTVLGAAKKDDLQINYNTVYIITDGDFANAEKHKVSRLKAGQNEEIVSNVRNYGSMHAYCDWDDIYDVREIDQPATLGSSLMTNLHEEKTIKPVGDYINKVYSKSLRYWKNGIVTNGIYVYVKNWGFLYLAESQEVAMNHLNVIKGNSFDYEKGIFDYSSKHKNKNENIFIPFPKDSKSIQFHYFTDGVLLKTISDYNRSLELKKKITTSSRYLGIELMSHMSKHPIIDMDVTMAISVAIIENKPFTGNIAELGFEKVYYFEKGVLTKWHKREDLFVFKNETALLLPVKIPINLHNPEILEDSIKQIKLFEESIITTSKEELVSEEEDEEFIRELIFETFQRHSEEISETVIELSDWQDNSDVKIALTTLELITHTLKDFIETSNKK